MIRLAVPKEPFWIELLEGVRIKNRPVTRIEQSAARAWAQRQKAGVNGSEDTIASLGGEVSGLPDMEDPDVAQASEDLLYAQGLARRIIIEWEGVLDKDGTPADVTPEAIDEFMLLPYVGELFMTKVQQQVFEMFAEGNGSGPEPDGTSATAPDTAGDVETPTPPVVAETKGKAGSTAPTSPTSSRQRKAGKRGS